MSESSITISSLADFKRESTLGFLYVTVEPPHSIQSGIYEMKKTALKMRANAIINFKIVPGPRPNTYLLTGDAIRV